MRRKKVLGDKNKVSRFQFIMMLIGGALLFGGIVYASNGGFVAIGDADAAAYTNTVALGSSFSKTFNSYNTYGKNATVTFKANTDKTVRITSSNGYVTCPVASNKTYYCKYTLNGKSRTFLMGSYLNTTKLVSGKSVAAIKFSFSY